MFIIKKCVSDRHYLIRYPEFSPGDGAKKKEKAAVLRMNEFYDTLKREIMDYCGELVSEHPRVMYLADTECTSSDGEEERTHSDGEEIPWDSTVTVRVALVLRNRPEPTRRLGMVHTWKEGYLVK